MMPKALAATMGKGLLTINMAALLRVLLHGSSTLRQRLNNVYAAVDPFDRNGSTQWIAKRYLDTIPGYLLNHVVDNFSALQLDGADDYIDGSLPWVDLVSLLAIARDRAPRSMLEIGTYCGCTTRILAMNLPDCTVHTIDLPVEFDCKQDNAPIPKDDFHLIKNRRVGEAFHSDPSVRNIVQHYGDTANWDFQQVKDATLFLIDGSHTYEYTRNDTEKCLAGCKGRRATILWHDVDIGHPGVVRCLSEMVRAGFPVKYILHTHLAVLDC